MSTAAMSLPAAPPAVFPPPAVPLRFMGRDLYQWPTGDTWRRGAGGQWMPEPDDGTRWLTDSEVRYETRVVEQRITTRFVPGPVDGGPLPAAWLHSVADLRFLTLRPARSAAQDVYNGAHNRLVTVRELVAAHDIPGLISLGAMHDVLETVNAEQRRPELSYHRPSGRPDAHYEREPELKSVGYRFVHECQHALVLSAADTATGA